MCLTRYVKGPAREKPIKLVPSLSPRLQLKFKVDDIVDAVAAVSQNRVSTDEDLTVPARRR